MPYVTSERDYKSSRHGVNHHALPLALWWEGDRPLTIDRTGSSWLQKEQTYSYRSVSSPLARPLEVMTGTDMRDAILSGDVLEIDPSVAGGIVNTGEKIRRDGHLNSTWDQGHEFWSYKSWRELYSRQVDLSDATQRIRYKGHFYVHPNTPGESFVVPATRLKLNSSSRLRLNALGNRAISESAPTAPEANLATLVAELRQLPTIPGMQALRGGLRPRDAGGEYLNVMFGWKPLIDDVVKLSQAVLRSRVIVDQMLKDNNQPVRRRRILVDDEVSTTVTENVPVYFALAGNLNGSTYAKQRNLVTTSHVALRLDKTVETIWFSGAFSYFLDETDSLLGKIRHYEILANKLLGGRLDAAAIWELAPWSWLIDWFLDLQSFIGRWNRLASDNLVLRYGYVMRKVVAERAYMLPDVTSLNGTKIRTPMTGYHSLSMERARSTPFGFGLDVNALSAQRWAILAALGLTKSPRNLRSL